MKAAPSRNCQNVHMSGDQRAEAANDSQMVDPTPPSRNATLGAVSDVAAARVSDIAEPGTETEAKAETEARAETEAGTPDEVLRAPVTEVAPESGVAAEPIETRREVQVGLQRSVRYGRIIVGGMVLGIIVAVIVAMMLPVAPDADYELGQVVGFSALIGAAIGLAAGAVFGLILGVVAKRQRGAAIAVLTDVR